MTSVPRKLTDIIDARNCNSRCALTPVRAEKSAYPKHKEITISLEEEFSNCRHLPENNWHLLQSSLLPGINVSCVIFLMLSSHRLVTVKSTCSCLINLIRLWISLYRIACFGACPKCCFETANKAATWTSMETLLWVPRLLSSETFLPECQHFDSSSLNCGGVWKSVEVSSQLRKTPALYFQIIKLIHLGHGVYTTLPGLEFASISPIALESKLLIFEWARAMDGLRNQCEKLALYF